MTVAPVPGRVPISTRPPDAHGRLVQWAVRLSAVFVVAVVAAITTLAIGYAAGGQSAVEDNWVAVLAVTLFCVGLPASLAAFVLAVVAKIRGERWTLLWAPLCAFPAFIAFLVLGEAFWWE